MDDDRGEGLTLWQVEGGYSSPPFYVPKLHDVESMKTAELRRYFYAQEVVQLLKEDPRRTTDFALDKMFQHEWETTAPAIFQAWKRLLDAPVPTIVTTMMDLSDQGQWLRLTSPFVGIVDDQRSFEILAEAFDKNARAARQSRFVACRETRAY